MLIKSKLSEVYHSLIAPEILSIAIPKERFANCDDCHHCIKAFNPRSTTKCCTYHPVLPNYMVGAILSSDNPLMEEGKRRVLQKISDKLGITPYGIIPPAAHHDTKTNRAKDQNLKEATKTNILLKCPFYHQGGCSIWQNRTENCSTFFCTSVGGKVGEDFWNSFHQYFISIEHKVAIHSLTRIGYPLDKLPTNYIEPDKLGLDDKEGHLNEDLYTLLWNKWKGNEIEFYKQCFQYSQELSSSEVNGFLEPKDKLLEETVKVKANEFNKVRIPEYLIFDASKIQQAKDSLSYEYKISPKNILKMKQTLGDKASLYISESDKLIINPLEYILLKMFDGKTPSYNVIRKAQEVRSNLTNLIICLMSDGVLKVAN